MIYPKPDGTIELGTSGCCCPPGQKHRGLHTQAFTHWWRICRPESRPGPWKRNHSYVRSDATAEEARTCDEFLEEMK